MNSDQGPPRAALLLVPLLALLLAGCGGSSSPTAVAPTPPAAAATAPPATPPPSMVEPIMAATAAAAAEPTAAPTAAAPAAGAAAPPAALVDDPSRKIIKNADMTIVVESVEIGLSRISGAAAQVGGYVLETRTDYSQQHQRQAVLRVAVPVDQFEAMLQRVRESAINVLSEQASGQDVTQEFVDTQSQVANLEATQARIRQFLDQATSVEQALQVNAQLTEIEGQISLLKGRLQFLSQRAAYSTITVQLQQPPPPPPPPSPTPVPTPTRTPEPFWNPGKTSAQAYGTLTTIVQAIGTVAIWLAIVVLPLVLPLIVIGLLVRFFRRRAAQPRPLVVPPGQGSADSGGV